MAWTPGDHGAPRRPLARFANVIRQAPGLWALGFLSTGIVLGVLGGALLATTPWGWFPLGVSFACFVAAGTAMALRWASSAPRALGLALLGYLAPGVLAFILGAGTAPLILVVWPYFVLQGAINCPLGLPCPLGR